MAAGKDERISVDLTQILQYSIGSGGDLGWSFAAGAAIEEQIPARAVFVDLHRATPLVFAKIPFDQVSIDFGCLSEAGQLAGQNCALQRACKDADEFRGPPQSFV